MPRDNDRRVPLIERKIIRPFNYVMWGTVIGFIIVLFNLLSFIDAASRAKVAKVDIEWHEVAIVLEQYFVDAGTYPPGQPYTGDLARRVELTTPVPYVTEIPESMVWVEYFIGSNRLRILLMTTFPLLAITCFIWFTVYRKMPQVVLVNDREAAALWLLGSLFFLAPHVPNADVFVSAFFVPGCFASLLWIGHYYGRSKGAAYVSPSRAFLLCAILPLLFTLKIAHNTFIQQYAESMTQSSRQTESYLYATDAKSFWILLCTGPDNVYDTRLEECPMESNDAAAAWLIQTDASGRPNFLEYDPTNGTLSTGDLMRSSLGVP